MGKLSAKEEIFQDIVKGYTIKGAFENWMEYRQRITDYLIKYTVPGQTIAILGIGEANDIDLKRLYAHIGNLTLVDKNAVGMKNALVKYDLVDKPNIRVIEKDFVGITDDDYKDVISICLQDMKRMKAMFSPMMTGTKVLRKMNELYEKVNSKDIDLGIEPHDYVVSIGLHSQLNGLIEHIWNICLQASNKYDTKVAERVIQQNNVFIPRFCRALENAAINRLFVGVETREVEKQSGVQGAQQTIEYFNNTMTDDEIDNEKLVIYEDVWNFTNDVTYYMAIFNRKK